MKSSIYLLAVLVIASAHAQIFNHCDSQTTCHDCIQRSNCAWCLDPNYKEHNRCFEASYSTAGKCPEEYIWNPDNAVTVLQHKALSRRPRSPPTSYYSSRSYTSASSPSSDEYQVTQVAPQRVNMKLRKNEAYKIKMSYTQAEDCPIDVYYIIDLNKSMENHTEKVYNLAVDLIDFLKNITSNFRIGLGSDTPCENCQVLYRFQGHIGLNTNTAVFLDTVKHKRISDFHDIPESGSVSHGLLQALMSPEKIGWRTNAKKLLIFVTNSDFRYSEDQQNDAPRSSVINESIQRHGINVIFAVPEDKINNYNTLITNIEGSAVGKLSDHSSNVIDLVKNHYNQISSYVEFKNNLVSGVEVNYYSSCLDLNEEPKQTNKCSNIKVGDVVQFGVEIEVTACPKDPKNWKQTLQIYPVGIKESLTVHLEMLCSCPCETPGHYSYKPNAEECFGNGVFKCGVCDCQSGYFGKRCECGSLHNQFDNCMDNKTNIVCSDRGSCICGKCECHSRFDAKEVIYGEHCQCDNFSCDRFNGRMCSGLDHGVCDCGVCQCRSPWIGSDCSCNSSNESCYSPGDTKICSGHGLCVCGKCQCEATENGKYAGEYCSMSS